MPVFTLQCTVAHRSQTSIDVSVQVYTLALAAATTTGLDLASKASLMTL